MAIQDAPSRNAASPVLVQIYRSCSWLVNVSTGSVSLLNDLLEASEPLPITPRKQQELKRRRNKAETVALEPSAAIMD